jgi:hypothetical protein
MFVFATSCKKPSTYSIVPALEYKSLTISKDSSGNDSKFTLSATFTDGDGDVGYYPSGNGDIFDDTASQYYYNFVVTLSILQGNVWEDDTAFKISARLPYLTPLGANKSLKATIDKSDDLPFGYTNTSIRFEAFIYDRALHKSNIITTPIFVINTGN